jgi:hypothetical protein
MVHLLLLCTYSELQSIMKSNTRNMIRSGEPFVELADIFIYNLSCDGSRNVKIPIRSAEEFVNWILGLCKSF